MYLHNYIFVCFYIMHFRRDLKRLEKVLKGFPQLETCCLMPFATSWSH